MKMILKYCTLKHLIVSVSDKGTIKLKVSLTVWCAFVFSAVSYSMCMLLSRDVQNAQRCLAVTAAQ